MNFYTELYTSKGKQVVPIDEAFGSNPQAWNFKSPKGNKKRYYSIDVRFLHDKYNIDELLIVTLHYGLQTVGRSHAPYIVATLGSTVIDVNDNSIVIDEITGASNVFRGFQPYWFINTLEKAMSAEKAKYDAATRGIKPAPKDKAVIYFARIEYMMKHFCFFDSARFIGKFSGRNYFRYECDPGRHLFWARSLDRDFAEMTVEAGKVYFIVAKPYAYFFRRRRVYLNPVNNNPEELNQVLSLIHEKAPLFFSRQKLENKSRKLARVIRKGLIKYKESNTSLKHW